MPKFRIKAGAKISRDFFYTRWPDLHVGHGKYEKTDENLIFDCVYNKNGFWDCSAPGFGKKGDYGAGSIFVFDKNDIEEIP